MMKRKLISQRKLILIGITVLLFGILLTRVEWSQIRGILNQAEPLYLIWATLITLLFPVLCAVRWNLIIHRLGTKLGLWDSYKIVMAAWPLGAVTPAKSGDLIKLLFLRKLLPYTKTTGVILAERVVDVVVLCLYALLWGWWYRFETALLVSGGILAGAGLFLGLAASPWVRYIPHQHQELVIQVLEASRQMGKSGWTFLSIIAVTVLNWFLSFLQVWLGYQAFGAAVPLSYIFAALPIAIFIGLIPVTLSGMGTRDSAMIYLFQTYAPYEVNLANGILYSIFGYWLLSLLGIPFMKAAFRGEIGGIQGAELERQIYQEDKLDAPMNRRKP